MSKSLIHVKRIDDRELQRSLNRLSVLMKKELPVLGRQSARRIAVNLARSTAPFGFGQDAFQRGRMSVIRDHYRVFEAVESLAKNRLDEEQRRQFAWLTNNAGPGRINSFLKAAGIPLEYARTARRKEVEAVRVNGKVSRRQAHITVVADKINRTVEKAVKRVGLAKHGWALCARQLGGTRGIAAKWVTSSKRQPGAGIVQQSITQRGFSFQLTNNVPYVSNLLTQGQITRSLRREGDFLRKEIDRRQKTAWRK